MNRILLRVGFIALLTLFGTLPSLAESFESGGLCYTTLDDKTCEITGRSNGYYPDNLIIPETITHDGVDYTVVAIGNSAFYQWSIDSITLPESLLSIGELSFFNNNSIKSIVIPNNVTTIGRMAFGYCHDLNSVEIGSAVKNIGEWAFAGCTEITRITTHAKTAPECGEDVFKEFVFEDVYLQIVPKESEGYDSGVWANFSTQNPAELKFNDEIGIHYRITDPEAQKCKVIAPENGGKYSGNITIPSKVRNNKTGLEYDVVAIAQSAFSASRVNSVIIQEGVTRIESKSFNSTSYLTEITLPKSLQSIGEESFHLSKIKNLVIPENVTTIETYAFLDCSELMSVEIGKSVEELSNSVFGGCDKISKITVNSSVAPKCDDGAFSQAVYENAWLNIVPKDATGYDTTPWSRFARQNPADLEFEYGEFRYRVIDENLHTCKIIPAYDESGNAIRHSGEIIIPSVAVKDGAEYSVVEIGDFAFQDCRGITSVTLPESLQIIGRKSFEYCRITKIDFPETLVQIKDNAFFATKLTGALIIPSKVEYIGNSAFGLTQIISVSFPESVKSISESVFSSCDALAIIKMGSATPPSFGYWTFTDLVKERAKVVVPEGSVEEYKSDWMWSAFGENIVSETNFFIAGDIVYEPITDATARMISGCITADEITIPNEVSDGKTTFKITEIADKAYAMYDWMCDWNVLSLNLPETLEKIGEEAFIKLQNLRTVTSYADVPPVCGKDAFNQFKVPNITLWVNDAEAKEAYSQAEVWKDFGSIKTLEDLEFVDDGIRYRIIDLHEQTCKVMPRSNDDTSLQSRADDGAVYDMSEIVIPFYAVYEGYGYRVVEIAEGAFRNCTEVTSVTIPPTVTTIGSNAFENCGITEIVIPESVTEIKEETFKDCNNLAAVTIPARVETIGRGAFVGCEELMWITMEGSVPPTCEGNDYSQVFSEKTVKEATLVVPAGSTDDYDGAAVWEEFGNKTRTITVDGISFEVSDKDAKTVTVIGFVAGSYDGAAIPSTVAIDGVTYTVKAIGEGAFKDCAELTKLVIPATVETIGDGAFAGCTNLISVTALSDTPAEIAGQAFDDAAYSTVMLAVPEGTADSYRQANDWSRFVNIVDGTSGIDSIEADGGEVEIYDLTGRRVKHPTAGFYIVNGRKVLIRR